MLGQFARQQQPDGGLDLSTADGRALVVVREPRRLAGDPLEDVVHERVHDAHGLAGDARVGMHLLQHLIDVDAEALLSSSSSSSCLRRRLWPCLRPSWLLCWQLVLVAC